MLDASVGTIIKTGPCGRDFVLTHLFHQYKVSEPWNCVELN